VAAIPAEAPTLKDRYYIVTNSKGLAPFEALHPEPFRLLIAEVQHLKDHYGWLGLLSFNMDEIFRYSDLRMIVSAANQIAVALTNIDLYTELEQFLMKVVRSLVFAIEAKDTYTRGHSERVSQYCMRIANGVQMNRAERRDLLWASILHDMGKIGIPESVLNKPGKLTDEEYELIKAHPQKGYNILKPLTPLSRSLGAILHHHERFDGKGYPQGLKGKEIPFHARIIAVADTYDAITSDRSYRSRKTKDEALAIMDESAGTQLDAELVRTFVRVLDESELAGEAGDLGENPDGGLE
jgi:HD-GYP domain-containing protein (c-di-GMP phosphodiesterase class II)